MKKAIFTLAMLTSIAMFSQVGVNTTTPKTTLDVVGKPTDTTALDGILAPRLTGDQLLAKNYTADQTGALVYITVAASAPAGQTINVTSAGYYYFDGALWQAQKGTTGTAAWGLTGNAGTTAGTNFIGTTDNKNLVFKTNNTEKMTLTTKGTLLLNGGTYSGYAANIFAGYNIGNETNATGLANVAFGWQNMSSLTSGNQNVSFGLNPLTKLTTGSYNMAFGREAGSAGTGITSGQLNIVIGNANGASINTGSSNLLLGNNTDVPTLNTSSFMNLGNAIFGTGISGTISAPAGNIGIGTATPTSKLEVNGAATNTTAFNAGSGTSIDFTKSNLAYTSASAGAITLTGLKDGGTYTLAVQGTTSGTAAFTASGFTVKYVNNGATTAGKQTLYTILVMGTTAYVYMATGF